jgi:hypothetical protein
MMSERRVIIAFLLLAAILYVNSVGGDFVIDDTFLVRDNTYLDSFSKFASYFTSGTRELGGRPVRLASFYLDTMIFGKNHIGYHISNILYYMVLSTLVYFFSRRICPDRFLAAAVTLLFVAHPLHTEGVAYISGRKDVLGGIFGFASLICYDRYMGAQRRRDGLLTVLLFLLAIGTKEIYAVLPILYLALSYYRGSPFRKQKVFYIAVISGVTIFLLYVIFLRNKVFFDYTHTIPVYGDNKGVNFPTAIKICALILYLSFFPYHLSADYTYNAVKRIGFTDPTFYISFCALLLLALGVLLLRSRHRAICFGLLWLLVCLLPVCQLVPYPEIISERSLMLLSLGSCIILAWLLKCMPRNWALGGLLIILTAFSATTIRRNLDWQDGLTLWQATAAQHPRCARARFNLGVELAEVGKLNAAEREFKASLTINPPELTTVPDYSFDALLNLGNICALRGEYKKAKDLYEEVLHYNPKSQLALQNLRAVEGWEEKEVK